MKISIIQILIIGIGTSLISFSVLGEKITEDPNGMSPYEIPEVFSYAYIELRDLVKRPVLPESDLYRLGILVDERFLSNPEKAIRKSRSIGKSTLKDTQWFGGSSNFSCSYFVKNPEPIPTELPAEQKQYYLKRIEEREKVNPEFDAEEYLAKKLDDYQKSKEYINKGQLDIRIINAQNRKAAFDYHLSDAVISSMPLESIAVFFNEKGKVEDLGTVGFAQGGVVRFIRDNISVVIRGNGEFESDVMAIAKKIDDELLKRPLLTYEQLLARRPSLQIVPAQRRTEKEAPSLEYTVHAPAGVQAWVTEMKIDSTHTRQDGRIYLEKRPEKVVIDAVVVSDELLITEINKEITLSKE